MIFIAALLSGRAQRRKNRRDKTHRYVAGRAIERNYRQILGIRGRFFKREVFILLLEL
jgi:hypothetical protein